MEPQKAVIKTVDLTKVFRDFFGRRTVNAVEKLNLEVYRGEIFGFLGPNGSGKTTTMKLLLGLLFPTRGKAFVLDKEPSDVMVKQRIGFLPEESYLYRFLTARETMDFYGKLFGLPKDLRRERTEQLLELAGLQKDAWDRPIKEYSKGMARRVGLAQALVNDPELIFLDEPTSGLDPIVSRQMKDLILKLKSQGKTIFMSSHLLADVQNVCDRIGIIYRGRFQKIGSVTDLLMIKEQLQIKVKGMPLDKCKEIGALVNKHGGEVMDISHPLDTLESLFLKTIKEENEGNNSDSKSDN
ncbi:MAG: ABC transporter ATP-binding protein [Planctomycetes bacterium]|nr:ABC transporter ATP-binding protein [Planctomycetota bacterium]